MDVTNFKTINVRFQDTFCFLKLNRPEENNSINNLMVEEIYHVTKLCQESITALILEGNSEVFCFGGDFKEIYEAMKKGIKLKGNPELLYNLWLELATGPYITISHVKGKVNAGGIGFVAASDIVVSDYSAEFSLSELLFGLFPACVLPFLIRKIGLQRAHYMSLITKPICAEQVYSWGLIDALDEDSESLLRKHLLRIKHLEKYAITKYKKYINSLDNQLTKNKSLAVESNLEIFSDSNNLAKIFDFMENVKY